MVQMQAVHLVLQMQLSVDRIVPAHHLVHHHTSPHHPALPVVRNLGCHRIHHFHTITQSVKLAAIWWAVDSQWIVLIAWNKGECQFLVIYQCPEHIRFLQPKNKRHISNKAMPQNLLKLHNLTILPCKQRRWFVTSKVLNLCVCAYNLKKRNSAS